MFRFASLAATTAITTAALLSAGSAFAADVTLRVHHFLPPPANLSSKLMEPWAKQLEAASDGRIDVELFPAMSLGGRPGDLIDQAADGAVDIVLTLPGYTPGRFNKVEVFELPFMMRGAKSTSLAAWQMMEDELQDGEFEDVQILATWVHGPGVIHSKDPIESLEDMAGKEVRGPTRVVTDMLGDLGATPVGMPLPAIPENLSKGVISATVIPWEITPAIKLGELVQNHTEIAGESALYTSVFVLAMNIDSYDNMPDDLRALLDAETGAKFSGAAGQLMEDFDATGRNVYAGNNIITIEGDAVQPWIDASKGTYERWIARAGENGFDGQAAIDQARALIDANQ